MRTKQIYFVVLAALAGFLTLSAFTTIVEDEPAKTNKDIIKFSHSFHIEVTDCASCHSGVVEAETLSDRLLPEKANCAACHDVDDDENCTLCHYEDNFEALISTKYSLFFNHKLHLTDSKLECTSCHKGLDEVDYSFEAMGINPAMETCYQCHNNETVATNNCESCHAGTTNLVPENHKTVGFFKEHKFIAEQESENCAMCHDNNFCETCHVSTTMIDETNTPLDFYTPYSPHQYVDGAKQMQLNRVHDLTFRFSHAVEAKGKTSECQTCHQVETFCVECHSSTGGDFASEGFVPTSHLVTNFVTIGAGSGGGEHADLAKRDIESCAACHDTQGADPSCILCHMDNDGIRGTNPRTHTANFMGDTEHGDWHNDMGSVCYNCHTDANARPSGTPGLAFCGYCHGSH